MEMMEAVVELRTSNSTIKGAADSYNIIFDFANYDVIWNWV